MNEARLIALLFLGAGACGLVVSAKVAWLLVGLAGLLMLL